MKKFRLTFAMLALALVFQSCTDHDVPAERQLKASDLVTDLRAPIGMTLDDKGNMWVTEAGSGGGAMDGTVLMITPAGIKTTFVTGFLSVTNMGSIEGLSKPLYHNGKLYIPHGVSGMLYIADVSGFQSGTPAVKLTDIPSQDIGTYVKSLGLTNPLNSNIFDLIMGPGDHLYMVDAGANAIIKRDMTNGTLSKFAHFDNPVPNVETVPTGIVYDGSRFLVSSLTGFPFASGNARIYQVDNTGKVMDYKTNFTTLAGITLSADKKPVVIHHGVFNMGFTEKSGKVLDENGKTLLYGLSQPTDIERNSDNIYYVLSYKDKKIIKATY